MISKMFLSVAFLSVAVLYRIERLLCFAVTDPYAEYASMKTNDGQKIRGKTLNL